MGGEGKGEGGGFSVTVAAEDEGMTARGVLRRARGVSQRLFRTIAHGEDAAGGGLFINGRPARFRDTVRAGDDIRLVFPEESSHIEPQDIPLSVLYEDDDVLVADKQPGLVVHPTKGHKDGTLANAILWHMRERGENYKPRFISRLDMDTSGVLLVGKNSHAQDSLAKQHAAGGFEKYYTAVLCGRLEDDLPHAGTIDLPIGLAQPGEPRRAVKPAADGGYPSATEYVVCRDGADGADGAENAEGKSIMGGGGMGQRPEIVNPQALTLVHIRLLTGRTHQIRVHFAHFGHPVLGDTLYGQPSPLIGRQALHAARLAFAHPATGRPMRFEAPLPADIAAVLRAPGQPGEGAAK